MVSRRSFLATAAAVAACASRQARAWDGVPQPVAVPWSELPSTAVRLAPGLEEQQRAQTQATLAKLDDDSLLEPFRKLGRVNAPGTSLGGWYGADGWAPGHCLGQWMSAMACNAAADPQRMAATQVRLQGLIASLTSMGPALAVSFRNNAFPSYTYDKLLLGMMDADAIGVPNARTAMAVLTEAAAPALPVHALDRAEMCVKPPGPHDTPSCLDENYTLPENQFLAWRLTGDPRYLERAKRFMLDGPFFDRLARGDNALVRQHAYSHMNALSSGLAAYLNLGDEKYLRAVTNGFEFVQEQSYPTGGWGPEEEFVDPTTDRLAEDLTATHRGFETPCGSYAHFKLTRTLLRLTRDSRYGDSMERVHYNTVLGALPLESDGRAFYYADYNLEAKKGYFPDRWPCCGGTLPMVATDYRRNIAFRAPAGLVVNLYQPADITVDGVTVKASGDYPERPEIALSLTMPARRRFTLWLRIPSFADGAEVAVNGRNRVHPQAGRVFPVTREWRNGDRVELILPLALRTEPLSKKHPEYVAVLRGPVVLFRRGGSTTAHSRAELLRSADDSAQFVAFTQLASDEPYSLFQRIG